MGYLPVNSCLNLSLTSFTPQRDANLLEPLCSLSLVYADASNKLDALSLYYDS